MSTAVFPTLAGLGWDVARTPMWKNTIQEAISGAESRVALWTYPRWQWDLTFDFLRQGVVAGNTYNEFSTLVGFFNARQGSFDTFQYQDADDNAVTGQALAIGDASTRSFQLVRSFGGFVEPVLAPHTVSNVYIDGGAQPSANWSVSPWGSSTPGVLTFTSAPGAGTVISADFSYYFPCRFVDDKITFANFVKSLYNGKKVSIMSVKN